MAGWQFNGKTQSGNDAKQRAEGAAIRQAGATPRETGPQTVSRPEGAKPNAPGRFAGPERR